MLTQMKVMPFYDIMRTKSTGKSAEKNDGVPAQGR
jgi:hypothetical protein